MNKKDIFIKLRDKFKDAKEVSSLYSDLHEGLEKTGYLDHDYFEHLKDKSGYDEFLRVNELSAKECGTALTFILRAEKYSDGVFDSYVNNGNIYKMLAHMCEVIDEK